MALRSVEVFGDARLTTQLHIPEHTDRQQHSYKKFKSRNTIIVVVVVVVVFCGICLAQHAETNHFTSCFAKALRKGNGLKGNNREVT